ncbi:MAG: nitroreductase family protein [Desulfovibrio sp.]|jgi:nitroreductase|nr:nitroreductase family protein [Desulfovibrio sp.]
MDLFEALFTRRSIRKFTSEPVSDADLDKILKAAMLAPSAHNCQTWRFIVVRDAAVKAEIAKRHPYAKMAEQAPVVIVVCGDTTAEKNAGFWVQDCSAAMENLLLAARGLNIGTVWCGLHPIEDRAAIVRELLGIPGHIMPLGLAVLGHTDQPFFEADRYVASKVHYDKW